MKNSLIPVRCPRSVKSQFSALCKDKETTVSEYIRDFIKRELRKHKANRQNN